MSRTAAQSIDNGFHLSWYPIALSSEVEPTKIVAKDVLGTRVIVYRNADGKPIVQHCPMS